MAINHADTTDIHLFAYVAASDPGAVGGGKAWVDTSGATKVLKVRNTANTGWDTVGSAGVSIGSTVTGATQGSILFAGASGALTQENSKLFWDETSKRLLLGCDNNNGTGLILDSTNLYYGGHIKAQFGAGYYAWQLWSDYNGGLVINCPPGKKINIGGGQSVDGYLMVMGYAYETGGVAAKVNTLHANIVGQQIKLAASQTADAFQILNSSSAVLAKFASNGTLELGSSATDGNIFGWYSGAKFLGTEPANLAGLMLNNGFKLTWVNGIGANGQNTGIGRLSDGVLGVQAGSGTKGAIDIGSPTASTVALSAKLAASQTADAIQIQNNSGTVIAKINSAGDICSAFFRGAAGTGNTYINNDGSNLVLSFNTANVCQIQDSVSNIYARYNSGLATYNKFNLATESPAQITANQNNYTGLTDFKVVHRMSSDAARNITGIVPGAASDGQAKILVNVGTFNITLVNESSSSTTANRFTCSTGADIVLAPNEAADIYYDSTSTRWRVFKK